MQSFERDGWADPDSAQRKAQQEGRTGGEYPNRRRRISPVIKKPRGETDVRETERNDWRNARVFDSNGGRILLVTATGRVRRIGGGTEILQPLPPENEDECSTGVFEAQ